MTDRLKGALVTFERDIRDDDAKDMLKALSMVKGVLSVKPYVTSAEDYMMYHKGHHDARMSMFKLLNKESKDPS